MCISTIVERLLMQELQMQTSNFQDKYGLTVNEAVKTLGICERKVRELIANNEIPHFRVGQIGKAHV